ncbi:DNA-packaging protein [Caudoviricetes sp.]|nr:DNA-packaging protein [Caudoviricetes sp.]
MSRPTNESKARESRQMTDKQLAFAVWLAQPTALRDPKTQEELAEVLGVSRQSLWRWARDPRVLDASRYVVLQNAGEPDKVVGILDMIHSVALENRDVRYAELWLKAVGVMAAQTNRDLSLWDQITDDSLDALSDEALQALRDAKAAEVAERETLEAARVALAGAGDRV